MVMGPLGASWRPQTFANLRPSRAPCSSSCRRAGGAELPLNPTGVFAPIIEAPGALFGPVLDTTSGTVGSSPARSREAAADHAQGGLTEPRPVPCPPRRAQEPSTRARSAARRPRRRLTRRAPDGDLPRPGAGRLGATGPEPPAPESQRTGGTGTDSATGGGGTGGGSVAARRTDRGSVPGAPTGTGDRRAAQPKPSGPVTAVTNPSRAAERRPRTVGCGAPRPTTTPGRSTAARARVPVRASGSSESSGYEGSSGESQPSDGGQATAPRHGGDDDPQATGRPGPGCREHGRQRQRRRRGRERQGDGSEGQTAGAATGARTGRQRSGQRAGSGNGNGGATAAPTATTATDKATATARATATDKARQRERQREQPGQRQRPGQRQERPGHGENGNGNSQGNGNGQGKATGTARQRQRQRSRQRTARAGQRQRERPRQRNGNGQDNGNGKGNGQGNGNGNGQGNGNGGGNGNGQGNGNGNGNGNGGSQAITALEWALHTAPHGRRRRSPA